MAAEHVAVVLVIGLVVTALVSAALPTAVGEWARYAVCSLFSDDCVEPTALAADVYEPPSCNVLTTTYTGDVGVDILFFDADAGVSFARVDRSDGTSVFTVVDTGGVGVSAEAGAEAHLGVVGVEAVAEAGLGLVLEDGQSWVISTAEADDFERTLQQQTVVDASTGWLPVVSTVAGWAADRVIGEVPEPHLTFEAGGVAADANASAGASLLGENVAGAEVGVESMILLGVERDRTPGETWTDTTYLQADLSTSGQLGFVVGTVEGALGMGSIVKVVRDLDDEIQRLEIETSVHGGTDVGFGTNLDEVQSLLVGGSDTRLVEHLVIDATSDADREVMERWIGRAGFDGGDLARLAEHRGQLALFVYEGDELGLVLGGKVALGAKLGLQGSGNRSTSTLLDAHYLGAPGDDGVRRLQPFVACLTAAGG
jgi:hypothetical protein